MVTCTLFDSASACVVENRMSRMVECHGTHIVAGLGEAALRRREWDGDMHVAERG